MAEQTIIICFDVIFFFLKQKDLLNWCVFCRFMFARVIESYRSVAEDGLKLEKVVCGRYLFVFSLLLLFCSPIFLSCLALRAISSRFSTTRAMLTGGRASTMATWACSRPADVLWSQTQMRRQRRKSSSLQCTNSKRMHQMSFLLRFFQRGKKKKKVFNFQ